MRTDTNYSRMRAAELFIGLFTVGCTQTTKQAGGLELILRSDLDVPQAFDNATSFVDGSRFGRNLESDRGTVTRALTRGRPWSM